MKNTTVTPVINIIAFTLFIISMLIIFIITPDSEISISEKRKLAQIPKLNTEEIISKRFMNNLEKYTLDQFPYRDTFRKIKTYYETKVTRKFDSSGYTESNGHIHKVQYNLNEQNIEKTFSKLMGIATELKSTNPGMEAYYSIIPDKSYYNKEIQTIDYEDTFKIIVQQQNPDIKYINIFDTLEENKYYNTDLHWKQEEIIETANVILEDMNKPIISQEKYKMEQITNKFNGSYGSASAFSIPTDTITILTNTKLENIKVFDYETNKYINIYNRDKAKGLDPYDTYLSGAKSLLKIENPDSKSNDKLIIFRDSFTSSLVPLLIDDYKEILLIDLRYINYSYLKKVINLNEYNKTLFLYNIFVLNDSESFKF